LQTWFYDESGNELCGGFYARARRKLDQRDIAPGGTLKHGLAGT